MLPTNRLFSIIQILRSAKHPIKAQQLAEEMEVSVRTIYRDIAELQNQYVPIVGEAGIGYILKPGFDMPPLMLTANELEAALLGAHWVSQRGDPSLTNGARDLIAKIQAVVPEHLQSVILDSPTVAPAMSPAIPDNIDMSQIRHAIREQRKVRIHYSDANNKASQRTLWPFVVAYFETVRMIAAWCEERSAFRHFRTDRITQCEILEDTFPTSCAELKKEWQIQEHNRNGKRILPDQR